MISNVSSSVRSIFTATLICFLLVSSIAVPVLGANSHQRRLKIAYASISPMIAGLWIAKEIGAFDKYGLNADLLYIQSGAITVQAMLGGDLDMAFAASNAVVTAILGGAPLLAVATQTDHPPMKLWVRPEITKPEQLEGKVLGITRPGSTTYFLTLVVLEKLRLKDKVKLQPLGGGPEANVAFKTGAIVGRVTTVKPEPKARALVDLGDLGIPFSQGLMAVKRQFYESSPKVIEFTLRAYIEGIGVLRTDKNRAYQVLRRYMRLPPDALEEAYDLAVKNIKPVPRVDPAVIQTVLDSVGKSNTPVSDFYDNRIIDQLAREGFFNRLYEAKGK